MQQALEGIAKLKAARREGRHHRQSRIQHRLAHRARSGQSADGFRDRRARRHRAQGKPRRAFPRRLSREERGMGQVQSARHQGAPTATSQGRARSRGARSPHELKQVIEEQQVMATRDLSHLARRRDAAADSTTTRPKCRSGMVVLDAVHQDSGRAGQRSGGALELQGRQVRVVLGRDQRQAAPDVHDAADHIPPWISP